MTDYSSRFLLAREGLESTQSTFAFTVFERVFKEYGLPQAIRTDNGVPFASATAMFGLSRLSVWWLRLGINLERIKPGNPQQNGRHERMHLTLKKEATKPAARNFFSSRPSSTTSSSATTASGRIKRSTCSTRPSSTSLHLAPNRGLTELAYPFHDRTITVTRCGRICFGRLKINFSTVFAGQNVGVKQVSERIWLVTFMDYDLGLFDDETCRLESAINPFEPRVLPMSPV